MLLTLGWGITAIGVVGCAIAWSLMNSQSHRELFILGMVNMIGVILLMGILDVAPTSAEEWVQATCTIVNAFSYQITIVPLAFAILGGTSTLAPRAKTIGLDTACQAVFRAVFNIVNAYISIQTATASG